MSYMLKYCSIRNQDHINSLLSLVGELRPVNKRPDIQQKDNTHSKMDLNLGILKTISEICPGLVEKAISLIDYGKINVYIERRSHRRFYIMEATTKGQDINYLVMKHFCTCHSYIDKVVLQKKEITCKHELAYYLIDSMYIPEVIDSLGLGNDFYTKSGAEKNSDKKEDEEVNGRNDEETIHFVGIANPLIKAHLVSETKFSEIYIEYTSNFFIDNGLFKKIGRQI
ncbi:uncharacterized protein cubi_03254 [Cryptosporidium ubiquitum]|uniref:SWIM-type domain-containing protein n=1 Tax=Cryptosporidium ubiquitum TaxID=857276 RepID=A0A1J4MD69_9CRYT|nr:uncharacterized protein cubi_03254 [Cryptosporidium ubiquitum]OII70956.1 hypothetical protein cubi_03254 [Cryptosporidium ubiquitum]